MVLQKRKWNTPLVLTQSFPLAVYTLGGGGGIGPPYAGGKVQEDKALMGDS